MSKRTGDELDPNAFSVRRAEVRDGLELSFAHEGAGGVPLLLVHGWPETKRIWWRNIGPLAAAGFEVIAPDLRGFGESGLAPDGFYDLAAHAGDLRALVQDVLGHERCVAVGGDLGGPIIGDLGLRYEGLVERQVIFNCPLPVLTAAYAAAGIETRTPRQRMALDYYRRQGREPEVLAAELDSVEKRRRYIEEFYGHRFWAAPGAISHAEAVFMSEPFGDPEKLLAGWANYGHALGELESSAPPRAFETSPVPTLALYGPEDHVIWQSFPEMCEVAFEELVGPFVVRGAGHFLQWERAALLNNAIRYFAG